MHLLQHSPCAITVLYTYKKGFYELSMHGKYEVYVINGSKVMPKVTILDM